jgi:sec-independent protein translocase protein TatA
MFGLGTQELLIILGIALFIFGAKKLPEIGKGLGKSISEFKRGISGPEEGGEEPKKSLPPEETKQASAPPPPKEESGGSSMKRSLLDQEIEKLPLVKEAKSWKDKADSIKKLLS